MSRKPKADVKQIKAMLWSFTFTQRDVALQHGVSESLINHIVTGARHSHVPWPDGSIGPMTQERRELRSQHNLRYQTRRALPASGDENFTTAMPQRERREHGSSSDRDLVSNHSDHDQEQDVGPGPIDLDPRSTDEHGSDAGAPSVAPVAITAQPQRLSALEARRARAQVLAELAREADQEIEEDMWSSLHDVKPGTTYREQTTDIVYKELPWEQISKERNVLITIAEKSVAFRRCVCIAFAMLPRSAWTSSRAVALVHEVATSLEINISREMEEIEI